jgi:quercetin dioxygenase-like cupin family protein
LAGGANLPDQAAAFGAAAKFESSKTKGLSMLVRPIAKGFVVAALSLGVSAAAQSLPEMRMTPAEIRASALDSNQIGSSAVPGVHTKVIFGDPAKAGFYTILLFVPPHTTIQAHSHRDDRVATVVSGEWHFGYGNHFDSKLLKTLQPGSVYSEPGGDNHFAQADNDAVVVEVSGYGPTDTHYFEAANDPRSREKR